MSVDKKTQMPPNEEIAQHKGRILLARIDRTATRLLFGKGIHPDDAAWAKDFAKKLGLIAAHRLRRKTNEVVTHVGNKAIEKTVQLSKHPKLTSIRNRISSITPFKRK